MNSVNTTVIRRDYFRKALSYKSIIILLYLMFSSPFLFAGIWFSNFLIPYFIKLILLILIIIKILPYGLTSQSRFLIIFCCLYTLMNAFLHPNSAGQSIGDLQDILFAIFSWNLIKKTRNNESFVAFLLMFSGIVAVLVVIESGVFLLEPSLFSFKELVGYEVFHNTLLGIVSIDNLRPCWYFAEPSYCGAFLLWNIVLFRDYFFPSKKLKAVYYLFVLSAFFLTSSFGSFIAIGITFLIMVAKRVLRLNNSVVILGLFAAVILFLTVFQKQEFSDFDLLKTHSLAARQERVEMGRELRSEMGAFDVLFGLGVNAATLKNDIGLSDAYNKMYIENGIIYLLLYLLIVYKMLKKDIIIFSAIILSLINAIVQIFPLTLFTIMIASLAVNNKITFKRFS